MWVPSADDFRAVIREHVSEPWWTQVPEGEYDLYVPGQEWEPDAASIALAGHVLPEVDAIVAEAVEYLKGIVDFERWGFRETPSIISLHCDAPRQRVSVEVNWEADLYFLWSVTFTVHEGERMRRSPMGMGRRFWGGPS